MEFYLSFSDLLARAPNRIGVLFAPVFLFTILAEALVMRPPPCFVSALVLLSGAGRALSLAEYQRVDRAGGRALDQSGSCARTDILVDRSGGLFGEAVNYSGFFWSLASARSTVRADGTGILCGAPLLA